MSRRLRPSAKPAAYGGPAAHAAGHVGRAPASYALSAGSARALHGDLTSLPSGLGALCFSVVNLIRTLRVTCLSLLASARESKK
jgi:hypothetical protein